MRRMRFSSFFEKKLGKKLSCKVFSLCEQSKRRKFKLKNIFWRLTRKKVVGPYVPTTFFFIIKVRMNPMYSFLF